MSGRIIGNWGMVLSYSLYIVIKLVYIIFYFTISLASFILTAAPGVKYVGVGGGSVANGLCREKKIREIHRNQYCRD